MSVKVDSMDLKMKVGSSDEGQVNSMDLRRFPIKMKVWCPDGSTVELDGCLADPDIRKVVEVLLRDSEPKPSPELIALARRAGIF